MIKKILGLLFALIFGFNCVNANELNKDTQRINMIGMKLLSSNNIEKRLTFDFTILQNQGAFPILQDYSRYCTYNLHNNRIITINIQDYNKMISDDEVAALLAHNIARGVNSYKGILNGQLMFTKESLWMGKRNELKYDKQAVSYLVNAGYNPVAIITAYDKSLAEWRGTALNRHNKANKRMMTIYNEIKTNYPQFLNSNQYTESANYKRFLNANKL